MGIHIIPLLALLLYAAIIKWCEDKAVAKSLSLIMAGALIILFFGGVTPQFWPEMTDDIIMCHIVGLIGGFWILFSGVAAAPMPE